MIPSILKEEARHLKWQMCVLLYFIIFLCPLPKRILSTREKESPYLEPIYWNMLDNIAHPPLLAPALELLNSFCANHQHAQNATEE